MPGFVSGKPHLPQKWIYGFKCLLQLLQTGSFKADAPLHTGHLPENISLSIYAFCIYANKLSPVISFGWAIFKACNIVGAISANFPCLPFKLPL